MEKPKTSLGINDKGEMAFFYIGHLPDTPEWASLDVEQGHLCIGGKNGIIGGLVMDEIDKNIYEQISKNEYIFLVGLKSEDDQTPIETYEVPLMVSTQL